MRATLRAVAVVATAAAVAATSAACASTADRAGAPAPGGPPAGYECNGRPVDADRFAARRSAASLPDAQRSVVEDATDDAGTPMGIDAAEWFVVGVREDEISLMRPLGEGDAARDPSDEWQHVVVGRLGSSGWMLTSSTTCTVTVDLSPLSAAHVALDPAHLPDPASTTVALLVTERACNSGRDAQGRIRLVDLVETADAVVVTIGVSPAGGAQDCPSNPPTPFTVTLAEPVGTREVRDGAVLDPRPLRPWVAGE